VDVLRLVPIYCGTEGDFLQPLAEKLARTFGLRVEQQTPGFDPELAFDSSRGQYNSRILLARLLQDTPKDTARVLGITGVDLFIPALTFVFGEAQLAGRAAAVSTYRLNGQLYGLPDDPDLLFERLCKEALHELGHTYDLVHCQNGRCVMTSSTYVEDIDIKSDQFCRRCYRALQEAKGR
jgi:archaemetzincin